MELRALAGLCLLASAPLWGQSRPPVLWSTSLQTGLADTFQMALGGTFGEGPAWQSRVSTGIGNAFRPGDSLYVYGWNTFDTRSRSYNWQAGLGYKAPVLKKVGHLLSLGSGVQRWLLPSVKCGANDWVVAGNLLYQTGVHRAVFLLTGDSWTLASSSLPLGSLLHTQAWLQYELLRRERFRVAFRHGPAHTYSWNFYGANGNRVFRYQTMLAITMKYLSIEGGYRKQWGLQPGIQNNNFWQFAVTRTFSRPILR